MAIHFSRPAAYSRAPRRTREPVARAEQAAGQLSLAQEARAAARAESELHPCPRCRAPIGERCTRPPTIVETGRQPLGFMNHAERHALPLREVDSP